MSPSYLPFALSLSFSLLLSFGRLSSAGAADCPGDRVVTTCTEEKLRLAVSKGGWVSLCCDGTITLSNTIRIERDVILDGMGHNVTISGGYAVRLFRVDPGVSFSITNVVLAAGRHEGVESDLDGAGAGILNEGGTVTLIDAVLINHAVAGFGGSSDLNLKSALGTGAAISSHGGALTVIGSMVASNTAVGGWRVFPLPGNDALGGGIYTSNTSVKILNTTFNGNRCEVSTGGSFSQTATARGGAMFHDSGSLLISNSIWVGNIAVGRDTVPFANNAPGNAYGGALVLNHGDIVVERTRFLQNVAQGGQGFRYFGTGRAQGGAVCNRANMVVRDTTFATNHALCGNFSTQVSDAHGGAVYNEGSGVMEGCSLYANNAKGAHGSSVGNFASDGGAAFGGAIFNAGQLAATNCSLFWNSATGGDPAMPSLPGTNGPGRAGNGIGGGIYNASNAFFTAMNSTIASNSVNAGRTLAAPGVAAGVSIGNHTFGTVVLRSSLLATGPTNGNTWGPILDGGYNLSSDSTPNFTSGSSVNSVDPLLAAPADNGGPTLTLALLEGSPAVDTAGPEGAPPIDQRGSHRPFGPAPDIGAYEAEFSQPLRLRFSRSSNDFTITFDVPAGITCHIQYCTPELDSWSEMETFETASELRTVTRTYSLNDASCRFFRLYLVP